MSSSIGNILTTIKSLNISSVISGTNKTLKTIKKAIPVYKEVRPYIRKEKSLFKNDDKKEIIEEKKDSEYNDTLTFFN